MLVYPQHSGKPNQNLKAISNFIGTPPPPHALSNYSLSLPVKHTSLRAQTEVPHAAAVLNEFEFGLANLLGRHARGLFEEHLDVVFTAALEQERLGSELLPEGLVEAWLCSKQRGVRERALDLRGDRHGRWRSF